MIKNFLNYNDIKIDENNYDDHIVELDQLLDSLDLKNNDEELLSAIETLSDKISEYNE